MDRLLAAGLPRVLRTFVFVVLASISAIEASAQTLVTVSPTTWENGPPGSDFDRPEWAIDGFDITGSARADFRHCHIACVGTDTFYCKWFGFPAYGYIPKQLSVLWDVSGGLFVFGEGSFGYIEASIFYSLDGGGSWTLMDYFQTSAPIPPGDGLPLGHEVVIDLSPDQAPELIQVRGQFDVHLTDCVGFCQGTLNVSHVGGVMAVREIRIFAEKMDDDRRICPLSGVAKPINVGSGNMHYDEPFFAVAENTAPLSFGLAYNSRETRAGPLGPGWIHSFAQTLAPRADTRRMVWTDGQGIQSEFFSADPATAPFRLLWPADGTETLLLDSVNGVFRLRTLEGAETVFGATSGEWRSTRDRWNNQITGAYTDGKLTQVTDAEGRAWTFGYAGSSLTSLTDADGNQWQFQYSDGKLSKIADPGHTFAPAWRNYSYSFFGGFLERIADAAGAVLEAHGYDFSGRATSSWSAQDFLGSEARDVVTLSYDSPTRTTVTHRIDSTTDELSVFTLSARTGRFLPTSIVGNCSTCSGGAEDRQVFVFDGKNHVTSKTVGDGAEAIETRFTYDANGMVLTRTEAYGKPEERTTEYAYEHPDWPTFTTRITEASIANPGQQKITTNTWNEDQTILTSSVSGYLSSSDPSSTAYSTMSAFDSRHRLLSIAGPRTNQLRWMTYYPDNDSNLDRRGRLATSNVQTSDLPPLLLATGYDGYDIYGTARSATDPNGVEDQRLLDAKGRVTRLTSKKPSGDPNEPPDYVSTFTFDARDRLTDVTLPRGNKLHRDYENGTNRLTDTVRVDVAGNQQERLHLGLNAIGDIIVEQAQVCATPAQSCAAWTTRRSESFLYDSRNRLFSTVHPDSTHVDYAYDSRGNLKSVRDERHSTANVLYEYDSLNRLKKVLQKRLIFPGPDVVTQYGYDVQDNMASVTDPNGNITTYQYDDFRRVQQQTSPVSGVTLYSYDEAGNLISSTDANGAALSRAYDAANRIASATWQRTGRPTETMTWAYDDATVGNYGKGRIATMTDPTGSATYAYERRGLLRSESKSIQGDAYTQLYGYDANGNRASIRYPSLRIVSYNFDFADRPQSASSGGTTFVSSAAYEPFGPEKQVSFGNGTTRTVSYDNRYRPSENKLVNDNPLTTLARYTYQENGVGNVTQIQDAVNAAYNRTFDYDDLNRLKTANSGSSLWGLGSYASDAMGNITSLTLGTSRTATFSFVGSTAKLLSVTENGVTRPVTYDGAGNETAVGAAIFTYSARNFLSDGDGLSYAYDGRGLRSVVTTTASGKRYFFYSPELNLISESGLTAEGTPAILYDYIWFDGHPVAQLDAGTRWTFTDHLGTPLAQTSSDGSIVWRAEHEPYGKIFALRTDDRHQPLRLPGQEAEQLSLGPNGATERFYNAARWYRYGWGRYTQPDPLEAGRQTAPYLYSGANPINNVDPRGLAYFAKRRLRNMPWLPGSCNPLDNYLNTETVHEQLFFEDGESPTNLGFHEDGRVAPDESGWHYYCKSKPFNDCLMRRAVAGVTPKPYCLLGIGGSKYNCQDWADEVRAEYSRLASDQKVWDECKCKKSKQ